jgi:hypothetical protein
MIARFVFIWPRAANLASHAQSVADFYCGKTINSDHYAAGATISPPACWRATRRTSRNPICRMAGAGSLRLANFLYNVAPKDGTAIGMVGRGMAMEPLIGGSATQYDARRYTWIGSVSDQVSLCASWHTSKVKRWDDMLKTDFTVGGEGSGSDPDMFATMIRSIFGVKMRLISGYPGGNEINLASGRGEVDGAAAGRGRASRSHKPAWLAKKQINLLLQMALHKNSELRGRSADHGPRATTASGRSQAGAEPAGDGLAVHGAARPAEGARRGIAHRLRRHHEGPGLSR